MLGGGGEDARPRRRRARHGAHRPRRGARCRPGTGPTRAARATSPSSCSPARASAPAPTGSPTAAGRCRRSAPRRRRALTAADTVYARHARSTTRRALLMTLGGAIAGGSRHRAGARLRPGDVLGRGAPLRRHRRLLHVDDAARARRRAAEPGRAPPPAAAAASAPACRSACGSACSARFAPARVVEFYASTEGEAILVNLTGAKAGCVGRPLPGARRGAHRRLGRGRGPAAARPRRLRARVRRAARSACCSRATDPARAPTATTPLRGVFRRDDAWVADRRPLPPRRRRRLLARRPRRALVRTEDGLVPPSPSRDALGACDAVDLAVAYGLDRRRRGPPAARRRRDAAAGPDDQGRRPSTRALARAGRATSGPPSSTSSTRSR